MDSLKNTHSGKAGEGETMKRDRVKARLAELKRVMNEKQREACDLEIYRMGIQADMAEIESKLACNNARRKRLDFEIMKTESEMNKLIKFE